MAIQPAEAIMPQSSSAQREPSMEEILASIRRIIEDSDQSRKGADAAEETLTAANADVRAFSRELREAPEQPAPKPEIDEDPVAASPEAPSTDAEDVGLAGSTSAPEIELGDAEDDFTVDLEEELDIDVPLQAANTTHPSGTLGETAADPVSIVSAATGRQVAASFGELTDAFAASRRRSFDEMAEEMLRPMLQDWLDNNLPTLVEKLVREEIERIARGGAR